MRRDGPDHARGMAVGGVDHDQIHAVIDQSPTRSSRSAPTPTAAPTSSRPWESFAATGKSSFFWMSLTVISPFSRAVVIHQGQLFDAVFLQDALGLLEGGAHRRGDQMFLGHELAHRLVEIPGLDEADVPVGEDAHQLAAAPGR